MGGAGEIKGSLEEVGEGDPTVVVAATLDGLSIVDPLHCTSKYLLSKLMCPLSLHKLPELTRQ